MTVSKTSDDGVIVISESDQAFRYSIEKNDELLGWTFRCVPAYVLLARKVVQLILIKRAMLSAQDPFAG